MIRRSSFWSTLGLGLLWAGSSFAEASAADRATARSLAGEGYQALQDKDYATATDRFSRADALVHAPTLMIDWARSLVGLGKLVEAQERYEQIIREGVEVKAPKPWHRALTDAVTELAQLKPRLAWITIAISGAGAEAAHVSIDDVAVPPAAIGVRRAVNPGAVHVRVRAKGFLSQDRIVQLREGAEEAAAFELEPDPDPQAANRTNAPPPPGPIPAGPRHPPPAYVAFGVSAGGLAVGLISGALFLSKRSDLSGVCTAEGDCQSTQKETLKAYHTFGVVSTIGYGVAVAGAGTGLALLLWNRDTGKAAPSTALVVHPYVGLGDVGAVGSF